jgi:hypothetical protein
MKIHLFTIRNEKVICELSEMCSFCVCAELKALIDKKWEMTRAFYQTLCLFENEKSELKISLPSIMIDVLDLKSFLLSFSYNRPLISK